MSLECNEYDLVSRWRHLFIYLGRAGVASGIKRRMRRRERHDARRGIRRGDES